MPIEMVPDTVEYDDRPTVLLFADSASARGAAAALVETAGGRVGASLTLGEAAERISQQAAIDAVIVEAGDDADRGALAALIDLLDAAARAGRHASVVIVPPALIDLAAARGGHRDVMLLCEADAEERLAAIRTALEERRLHLSDVGAEARAPRLRELSEEVSRIARTLATLSTEGLVETRGEGVERIGAARAEPIVDTTLVRAMIRARRLRDQYFPGELFADPAWDMLLDLIAARMDRRQVAVSSLCIAAAVPPTTALRWIKTLTDHGLFVRVSDPRDGRRVFIELSEGAANGMLSYLAAARGVTALPV